jgi:ion channel-forming bestrophin family protein
MSIKPTKANNGYQQSNRVVAWWSNASRWATTDNTERIGTVPVCLPVIGNHPVLQFAFHPVKSCTSTMPFRDALHAIRSSKTLASVLLMALLMGGYACLPLWKEYAFATKGRSIPSEFHAALSLVLGWLLVFRTNTAYQRWWEARTLWGSLVNASRNLSIKLCSLGTLPASEQSRAHQWIVAFPNALRCHLRDEVELLPEDIRRMAAGIRHVPQGIIYQFYQALGKWKAAGYFDGDELRVIDEELHRYMDICGACERIQRTRIVQSYRFFARQCVLLFLGTLPWGIVGEFGVWTIPTTIITSYFMLGLEVVAEHVEEPFGYDEDDLDLDGLCLTIESSVDEVFRLQLEHR